MWHFIIASGGVVLEDYLFTAIQTDTNWKVPLTSYDSKEDP